MASEEIKVVVRQENQGTALQDAARDAEQLQQTDNGAAASAEKRAAAEERVTRAKKEQAQTPARPEPVIRDFATQPRGAGASGEPRRATVDYAGVRAQSDAAASFMADEQRRIDSAAKGSSEPDERSQVRQAAYTTLLEAKQARASGDTAGAAVLEREAEILTRTLQVQRQMNVSVAEARVLATQAVDAERQIAAAKEAQAEAARKQKTDAAALRDETKRRADEERRINQEQREQDGRTSQQRRFILNAGGALGSGSIAMSGVLAEDYFARQQIALRDQAARASDARARELQTQRGYSSGEAIAHVRAVEDEIFNLQQQRPLLENQKKSGMITSGLAGAGAGAAGGAALGSSIPGAGTLVGGILGAVIGGGVGAFRGRLSGDRALQENAAQNKKAEDELIKAKEDQRKWFQQEVGLELEIRNRKATGNSADRRGIFALKDELEWRKEYNRLVSTGAEYWQAIEGANVNTFLEQRKRGGEFARLINARSGAADSARAVAASFIAERGPGGGGVKQAVDALHETTKHQFTQREWRELFPAMNLKGTRKLQ